MMQVYSPNLYTFVKVVECGSFSKAAETLHLSTVSVMKQVNAFEERINASLLHRTRKGVTLTKAGRVVYQCARTIIQLSDEAVKEAHHLSGAEKKVVRLGTSQLRPAQELLQFLPDYNERSFPFEISLCPFPDSHSGYQAAMASLGSELDIVVAIFGSGGDWERQYGFLQLGFYQCCCGVPKRHRLASKSRIAWDDMNGETLILIKRGVSLEIDHIRDEIERSHPKIQIHDVPGWYDIETFNFAAKNNFLIEMPEVWKDIHPNLVTIPVEWDFPLPYGIHFTPTPPKHIRTFLKLVKAQTEIKNG